MAPGLHRLLGILTHASPDCHFEQPAQACLLIGAGEWQECMCSRRWGNRSKGKQKYSSVAACIHAADWCIICSASLGYARSRAGRHIPDNANPRSVDTMPWHSVPGDSKPCLLLYWTMEYRTELKGIELQITYGYRKG